MPRRIYEAEFESADSRAEFDELLERAERSFVLPMVSGADPDSAILDRSSRLVQYQQLGIFLVRHAQILIALWDGRMSDDPGGTAHVVEINLRGGQSKRFIGSHQVSFDDLDPWDRGPCYHVVTPRESCPRPEGTPLETRILFPEPVNGRANAPERHRAILARIDLLNQQTTSGGESLSAEAEGCAGDLLPEEMREHLTSKEHELLHRFGFADALAKRMQRKYRWSLGTLLALVLLALASFEAYDNLFPEEGSVDLWSLLLLAAYPVALTVAFIGYVLAKRGGIQDMHIDYRALAEGLRVQLFWRMGGLCHEVSDHYLRKQTGELRWIHEAIRVSNVPTGGEEPARRETLLSSGERVLRYWIDAQRAYYVRATRRDGTRLKRGSRLATGFYVGSLGSTLVVLAMDGFARLQPGSGCGGGMRPILFMGIALMLGLSVLIRAYSEKMGFSEQAVQYQRMRDLFVRAERSLKSGLRRGDADAVQDILVELGEEALQENADWVLLRRSRGVEIPQGG